MFLVLNVLKFWICQSSEYASDFEYVITLNILEFCEYARLHRVRNMPKWFLNMPVYVWICLNMPEYTGICVNMPKSAWIASVLDFLICFTIPCLLEHVIIAWIRNMRLFPWRDTIWYFYSSWKYLIFFYLD